MTSWRGLRVVLTLVPLCALHSQEYPSAQIANGLITVKLYLPDPQNGSYRATRFDWSGIIRSLTYEGHEYFGQWYEKHDPLIHDAITGPVNIFDGAAGYAEAKPGETFVRIGVGRVEKPEEPAYRETNTYKVVDTGRWKVERRKDSIRFVQELPDTDGRAGYGYVYTKEIALVLGKPEMTLSQRLLNTGTRPLDTNVFNHGFFQIDQEPAGPGLVWTFPFEPRAKSDFAGFAAIRGDQVIYLKELQPGERVLTQLEGYRSAAEDHRYSLENLKTGAGVRVTGDRPIARLTFWSRRGAYAPEASIHLHIPPGQSESWSTTYDFYVKGRK